MSARKVKATEHTCDVCGRVHLQGESDELPLGVYVKDFFEVHGGGGSGASDVFVCVLCTDTPLSDVLTKVYERDHAREHPA